MLLTEKMPTRKAPARSSINSAKHSHAIRRASPTGEKLARLLAEPLGKVDMAVDQIELLLGMGNQPGVKRVEWLTLIAGWQLQLLQDETAAMETLTKIIADLPNTPQAFSAQRRLNLIKADIAARKT